MRAASKSDWTAVANSLPHLSRVSDGEIRRLLEPAAAVEAIERAFGAEYDLFVIAERQHLETSDGVFLLMPCYSRVSGKMGVKFVAVSQQAAASQPTIQATYLLIDPASAEPQLWLEANWLTALRTAATSFVASKFLARPDARVLGIFGTGRQARAHTQLFTGLRPFEAVLVCGSTRESTLEFVDELRTSLNIRVEAADATACAAQTDIICTCTTATRPLFDGHQLRPGTHLNLVGAFQPDTREVDSVTIARARVIVDTYTAALREAGEVLIPLREGAITREHISAELHEIVSGSKPARQSEDEITVFKSVGCALEDLVVAELIATKLEHPAR